MIYENIEDLTDPDGSALWKQNESCLRQAIKKYSREEFVTEYISKQFFYSIDGVSYQHPEDINPSIKWLFKNYPAVFFSKISDYISKDITRDGLSVNHCQVNIIRHIIDSVFDLSKTNYVLEIGAGYGALAREIMIANDNIKYVIIDLPEGLYSAYCYLTLEFPDKNHVVCYDTIPDDNFDVLYIPAGLYKETQTLDIKYDFCVNTCSFGEMPDASISKYYNLITNELDVDGIYWLNRFNNEYTSERGDDYNCLDLIPINWNVIRWQYDPLFLQCPYNIMGRHSNMLELCAQLGQGQQIMYPNNFFIHWHLYRTHRDKAALFHLIEYVRQHYPRSEELKKYIKTYNQCIPENH